MSNEELAGFEQVVVGAMSPDNNVRTQAEGVFQQGRQQPDNFFTLLLGLICQSQKLEVRHFCSVMLRQNLKPKADANIWANTSPDLKNKVKSTLLQLLKQEPNRVIRKSAVNAIGTLAPTLMESGQWPELLDEVLATARASTPELRVSAMDLLEMLCEFCVEPIKPKAMEIKAVIASALTDDAQVRVSAIKAVVAFVISLDEHEKPHLADTVPAIFETINVFYQAKDDDLLTEAIEQLVNLPKCEPTFLRAHLEPIVSLFFNLTGDRSLAPMTRRMGMEFILTLAAEGKGMVRKHPNFAQRAIPLAFQFLLELEHTPEWDNFEADDDTETQNFEVGKEAIARFALSLGGKIFTSVATPLVQQFLASPEWLQRHAGLTALSTMADGCKKVIKGQLPVIIHMVIPFVAQDPHHRVRWAAVNALAQLAVDFCPEVQESFHSQIVPALGSAMSLNNHPRLVAHAALCLVDFFSIDSNEVDCSVIVEPYLSKLLEALIQLLQCNVVKVQEGALSAVSALALVTAEGFGPYYDAFMPGLKAILTGGSGDPKLRELRGKAMECIGLVGKAVGKEKFGPDAKVVMDYLLAQQSHGLAADDPQYRYMVTALSRICSCMGADFAPYLPVVVAPLLKSAALENCGFITDTDDKSAMAKEDGFETIDFGLRGIGNKSITINTALLEEKVTACNCLYEYATALEDLFFPYVEKTASIVIPLLTYPFHEGIRVASIHTCPALLLTVFKHTKKNNTSWELLQNLWNVMYEPLLDAAVKEVALEDLTGILEAISEAVGNLREGMMSPQQIEMINTLLHDQISMSFDRRGERNERMNHPDFDEEELEIIEEENEQEDELMGYVHLVISKVCKCAGTAYMTDFHARIFPLLWPLLKVENVSKDCLNAAICSFDDVIWYGGEPSKQYIQEFLPIILQHSLSEDEDLRQSSVFGLGACSQALGGAFVPVRDQCLQVLFQVINAEGSRDGDNEPASDCAISSVGKICRYTYNDGEEPVFMGQKVLESWLSWLPIKADEEEACLNNARVCDFVESNNSFFLGANNKNLPKIIQVLARSLETECTTDELTARIRGLWNNIKQSMGNASNEILASMNEDDRNKLIRLSG